MTDIAGHILAVDDNRMNRIKLKVNLESQGHTVALAEDGESAADASAGHAHLVPRTRAHVLILRRCPFTVSE